MAEAAGGISQATAPHHLRHGDTPRMTPTAPTLPITANTDLWCNTKHHTTAVHSATVQGITQGEDLDFLGRRSVVMVLLVASPEDPEWFLSPSARVVCVV